MRSPVVMLDDAQKPEVGPLHRRAPSICRFGKSIRAQSRGRSFHVMLNRRRRSQLLFFEFQRRAGSPNICHRPCDGAL